jgi:hypothetical protein
MRMRHTPSHTYLARAMKRPEQQRRADMLMKVVAFNPRVVLRSTMFTKIKRKLIEVIRLILTRRSQTGC